MTTTLTATRARLRAQRGTTPEPAATPYTHRWIRNHQDNLWTLVVRISATRQQLRIGYYVQNCPGDLAAARIAARLYSLAK